MVNKRKTGARGHGAARSGAEGHLRPGKNRHDHAVCWAVGRATNISKNNIIRPENETGPAVALDRPNDPGAAGADRSPIPKAISLLHDRVRAQFDHRPSGRNGPDLTGRRRRVGGRGQRFCGSFGGPGWWRCGRRGRQCCPAGGDPEEDEGGRGRRGEPVGPRPGPDDRRRRCGVRPRPGRRRSGCRVGRPACPSQCRPGRFGSGDPAGAGRGDLRR